MSTPTVTLPPLASADQWLAAQPEGTVPPDNLDDMLAASSASIRRYCGWHVSPVVTMTLQLDGSGSYSQRLPSLRVVDVLSLTNGGTDVDVATLEWSADGYMRMLGARSEGAWYGSASSGWGWSYCGGPRWTSTLRGVVIELSHGFDPEECGQLAALCITLTDRAMAAPHGYMTAETVGTTTISYGGRNVDERPGSMTLLGYEQALLDLYRINGRRAV
jgi:hypothetical protein